MSRTNLESTFLVLSTASLLGLSACSSDTDPLLDASGAMDAATADSMSRDASAADAVTDDRGLADAGVSDGAAADASRPDLGPIDVGPDDSLAGTSLEGVSIEWNETLELCSSWRENRTLDQELEAKVHVTLPPQLRASPGRAHLSAARMDAGKIRRSPLFADQWRISDQTATASVVDWRLNDPMGDSSLYASVEHGLGAAGTLWENYSVYRMRGDPRPVVVTPESFEASFAYRAAGSAETVPLEPCGRQGPLEPAVEVLVASNGGRTLTVQRYLDTAFVGAGSFPVVLRGAVVVFSDEPWIPRNAMGFWAQTYSAQHHNWVEDTLIDFTRDPGVFELYYEPFQNGVAGTGELLTGLRMTNLNAFGATATVRAEHLDLATGAVRAESFDTDGRWRRVDTASALRTIQASCANGTVTTIGDGLQHAFHLMTCPGGSGGFQLTKLQVAAFFEDAEQIGVTVEGAAIRAVTVQGRAGFSIELGRFELEITKTPGDPYFWTIVRESGQNVFEALLSEIPIQELDLREETLDLWSDDRTVTVRAKRRWAAPGVGESALYAPTSFELSFGGATHEVEAWDRMAYTNTHHNWNDVFEARGDGLVMTLSTTFLPKLVFGVRAVRESDGVEVLPETALVDR